MDFRVINNTTTLRIVHSSKNYDTRETLNVVHKRIERPVIQLIIS